MKKERTPKSNFLVLIMYFSFFFSIYIDTIALRNIYYTMAAIVVKHMCALPE